VTTFSSGLAVAPNTWNNISLVFNFNTQTESGYVNGVLIASLPFSAPTTAITVLDVGYNNKLGTASDSAYVDSLSITATAPEPTTLVLVGAGLAICGFFFRQRRTA
jgi:hypothetical protein